jgi:DNA-binding XRE family transcriptional regulator
MEAERPGPLDAGVLAAQLTVQTRTPSDRVAYRGIRFSAVTYVVRPVSQVLQWALTTPMAATSDKRQTTQDVGYHDRRLERRLEDPEFRAEFERQQREIAAIDGIVNRLDELREEHRMSKAELARAIDKNPASIRRLLTASGNPELRTVVAMAQALGADVKIIPRSSRRQAKPRKASRPSRQPA